MAIRVYDQGSAYGISIGRPEIQGFCLGHPACGLEKLQGLWVTFDRTSGNLIDLQVRRGTGRWLCLKSPACPKTPPACPKTLRSASKPKT